MVLVVYVVFVYFFDEFGLCVGIVFVFGGNVLVGGVDEFVVYSVVVYVGVLVGDG